MYDTCGGKVLGVFSFRDQANRSIKFWFWVWFDFDVFWDRFTGRESLTG